MAPIGARRTVNPVERVLSTDTDSDQAERRRLAHGANGNASSCCRPPARHNLFLQCSHSFRATACSWFMIRVRACTKRRRCHNSCRRSRFSQIGTQIRGKSSFSRSFRMCCASCRSVFCLRARLLWIRSRLRSTTQTAVPPTVVRTSVHVCWLPYRHAPSAPPPPEHGRTSPHPGDAAVVFPETLPCQYPRTRFAETRGENRFTLIIRQKRRIEGANLCKQPGKE